MPLDYGGAPLNYLPDMTLSSMQLQQIQGYLNPVFVNNNGDTLEGVLNANNEAITNVPTPINPGDCAPKTYVDTSIANIGNVYLAKDRRYYEWKY